MNLNLYYEGISAAAHDGVKELIDRWALKHVEPPLSRAGVAGGQLVATVTRHAKGGDKYAVKLRMHLPGRRILLAGAEAGDLKSALAQAQARLLREIGHHLERLRHQADYKRKVRRQRLRELKIRIAELSDAMSKQAESGIDPLLPRLERVVRRELAYLRNTGDITGDYPSVQDVVDEAVAAVSANWRAGEQGDRLLQRLLREAFKALDREAAAGRRYGELVSLDAAPEQDAGEQAEAMVEEAFHEYYQPDEVLRLSDVLPDEAALPPESELEDTQRVFTLEMMCGLPISWRRALMLFEIERLAVSDIAAILDVELAQVEKWVEQASAFLYAHLEQAGFSIAGDRPLVGHGKRNK